MKRAILVTFSLILVFASFSQKPSLELTFTAIDSATHIQIDSIKVMNRSQGGDTVLYYPDTVLVLDYITGIEEVYNNDFGLKVYQNYPNPAVGSTTITIFIPEREEVQCMVVDIMGRKLIQYKQKLAPGYHSFSYTPGDGEISFFTVQTKDTRESIKVLHGENNRGSTPALEYLGKGLDMPMPHKALKATQNFSFSLGDTLLYIGYVDEMESGILDAPVVSDTFYFQFATNIPCPGTPTVTYEGQVYNTIQIFSQCWMKENLNVGVRIDSFENQTNNNTIEKYCLNNSEDSCYLYGGLYQWDEMMSYATIEGGQGICPDGWHIPSEPEWQILLGSVDTEYGIGDSVWMSFSLYNGKDVGLHLKSINGWANIGNGLNSFGFSVFPNGRRSTDGSFGAYSRIYGYLWTSRGYLNNYAYFRKLAEFSDGVHRGGYSREYGMGVRCIRNY